MLRNTEMTSAVVDQMKKMKATTQQGVYNNRTNFKMWKSISDRP